MAVLRAAHEAGSPSEPSACKTASSLALASTSATAAAAAAPALLPTALLSQRHGYFDLAGAPVRWSDEGVCAVLEEDAKHNLDFNPVEQDLVGREGNLRQILSEASAAVTSAQLAQGQVQGSSQGGSTGGVAAGAAVGSELVQAVPKGDGDAVLEVAALVMPDMQLCSMSLQALELAAAAAKQFAPLSAPTASVGSGAVAVPEPASGGDTSGVAAAALPAPPAAAALGSDLVALATGSPGSE